MNKLSIYNVYCDESCHLENDGINVMGLGLIWTPKSKIKEISQRIREIKSDHNVSPEAEIKWSKVSPSKLELYLDIVNYFFDDDDLHFRCLIVPDKTQLDHKKYNQTHDDWYYKMYFTLLKNIFYPTNKYNVYIDIKDTYSYRKSVKLHEVCCNQNYDFSHQIIKKIQPIRSNEVQIMQIVDILMGAICYENRKFNSDFRKSPAKLALIEKIKLRTHYTLKKTTLLKEEKFNLFFWEANYYRSAVNENA